MSAAVTSISTLLTSIEQANSPIDISGSAMHILQKVAIVRYRPYSLIAKLSLVSDSGLATLVRKHFAAEPGGRQELTILPVSLPQLAQAAAITNVQAQALLKAVNADYRTVLHDDHITMTLAEKAATPRQQKMPSKYEKYLK